MISLYITIVLFCVGLVKYVLVPVVISKTAQDPAASKYPHLDPFFGLDLAIQTWRDFQRGELCEGLRKRHLKYGATFSTNSLGSTTIYTTEPENIRTITTREFAKFGKSGWVVEAAKHIGSGVLMNEGEAWKHSRTMLKPMFSRTTLDEPTMLEPHVQNLVSEMRRLAQKGHGVFDFHELASMFTLDVVTEFLFGKSTDCLGNPEQADGKDGVNFLTLVKGFEGPSGQFIAVGPLAWFGLIRSYKRLISLVDGMKAFFRKKLNDIIADSMLHGCAPPGQPKFHKASLSIFRSMKDAGVSDSRIQGELQNIFFASYDTTSTFLANLIYVLVRHPNSQQRIRDEIAGLGGRPPTSKELARMDFLKMFIMEALRLYSPVSSHSRTAKVDTALPRGGGLDGQSPFIVRAGATVVWSTYTLNRDSRRYGDDWAEFRPERWAATLARPKDTNTVVAGSTADARGEGDMPQGNAADAIEIGDNWRDFFMPFGSGPRTCLGQVMVQTEVMYVLVRLLQEFLSLSMDVADVGVPFKEAKAVSFYNEGGVSIRVN
ncbi:unnamed protein product [Discula destructiva]